MDTMTFTVNVSDMVGSFSSSSRRLVNMALLFSFSEEATKVQRGEIIAPGHIAS